MLIKFNEVYYYTNCGKLINLVKIIIYSLTTPKDLTYIAQRVQEVQLLIPPLQQLYVRLRNNFTDLRLPYIGLRTRHVVLEHLVEQLLHVEAVQYQVLSELLDLPEAV